MGLRRMSTALQDNRVSDHRTKINFDLQAFLGGDIEGPVQVSVEEATSRRFVVEFMEHLACLHHLADSHPP